MDTWMKEEVDQKLEWWESIPNTSTRRNTLAELGKSLGILKIILPAEWIPKPSVLIRAARVSFRYDTSKFFTT